ncbi:hypothetical protein HK099_007332 [Clydaea vesicula]|uniref:Uncharacterized protein n=1 Tax=Clydaea vesicula TaxID=447962 RepID=A0AAD5U5I7_9FUNG|nr:hypothetical protein HK099_007332 [Clydaea vesicula]
MKHILNTSNLCILTLKRDIPKREFCLLSSVMSSNKNHPLKNMKLYQQWNKEFLSLLKKREQDLTEIYSNYDTLINSAIVTSNPFHLKSKVPPPILTVKEINALLSYLINFEQFDDAFKVLIAMRKPASLEERTLRDITLPLILPQPTLSTYLLVFDGFSRHRNNLKDFKSLNIMETIFSDLKREYLKNPDNPQLNTILHNPQFYNTLLKTYLKFGRADKVVEFWYHYNGHPSLQLIEENARIEVEENSFKTKIDDIFLDNLQDIIIPQTYMLIAIAFIKSKGLEESFKELLLPLFFDSNNSMLPDIKLCNLFLKYCIKEGNITVGKKIHRLIFQSGKQNKLLKPDLQSNPINMDSEFLHYLTLLYLKEDLNLSLKYFLFLESLQSPYRVDFNLIFSELKKECNIELLKEFILSSVDGNSESLLFFIIEILRKMLQTENLINFQTSKQEVLTKIYNNINAFYKRVWLINNNCTNTVVSEGSVKLLTVKEQEFSKKDKSLDVNSLIFDIEICEKLIKKI